MVVAIEDENDFDHRVEIGLCHAVDEDKATENICRVACSVEVDVTSKCAITSGHCGVANATERLLQDWEGVATAGGIPSFMYPGTWF